MATPSPSPSPSPSPPTPTPTPTRTLTQAGSILCSFELRIAGTFKDPPPPAYSGPASGGDEETADGAPGSSTALAIPQEISGHRSIRPPTKTYLIELSVVGCRDVPARDLFGVQVGN